MNKLFMKHSYLTEGGAVRKDTGYNLAKALGIKMLRMNNQGLIPKNAFVINWGRSNIAERIENDTTFLNHPNAVELAIDKLKTFSILKDAGISTLSATLNIIEFSDWLERGNTIIGRELVRGHSGEGIHILTRGNFAELAPRCKFFTKYYGKTYEFRVHVFKNPQGEYEILDYQQKRQRIGAEIQEYHVRNHDNGWIFCREKAIHNEYITELAIKSVAALGLDFGAVDIGAKKGIIDGINDAVVFEVNTAPGVEGTTFDLYVNAFNKYLQK